MRFTSLNFLLSVFIMSCQTVRAWDDSPRLYQDERAAVELRVMSFNIEWGGALISWDHVVKAIQLADADVVGIQEAEGNLQKLASELGWHYDLRNYVISRHPLIDPPGADGRYVYVEVEPGKMVAVANVHLPSDPYGPDAIRDGAALEQVLQIEQQVRMPVIETYLAVLPQLVNHGIPLFVTGDFNTPAHTDWIEATVGSRKFLRYPVAWPVSQALADVGFRDSWRTVHPDPLKNPGLTWWAGRPPLEAYAPGENDAEDRIDFIWYAGSAEARSSEIIGETNGPEVTIGLSPWPSDHRALVSEFLVTPAELPEFVSTAQRVYPVGVDIDVSFNTAADASIIITDVGTMATISQHLASSGRGHFLLSGSLLEAGHYQLRMSSPALNTHISREIWVQARDVSPTVEVAGASFAVGESISVRWSNAPGNRNDYLAVYAVGEETDYDNGLAWTYVKALPEGEKRIDETTSTWAWPLPPGHYVIRLVKDDGYSVLAESMPFLVESSDVLPGSTGTVDDEYHPIEEQ